MIGQGEHWDLMLEQGEVLLTWQLLRAPFDARGLPVAARRIGDHRKAYLEYEGPISGDRGFVRRVDVGDCEFRECTPALLRIKVFGGRLCGTFELRLDQGDSWTLACGD